MSIRFYNTLSAAKEEFSPLHPDKVNMYVCGITPYDKVHLGHARAYVTFDIIRRHLELSGFSVKFIQNFTDVDDKIIKRASEKNIPPSALAKTFIDDYFTQMRRLNIKDADLYPKVTETIPQIIKFVQNLIDKGYAYELNGDVYYSVRKFSGYGKLSKRNLEDLISGARVAVDEEKKDPLDFALWKKSKPGEPQDVSWDSPWGKGRPGWHIECSVMSTNSLGETIDIHGGGQDLIFPHHENEIAQSEAMTGKPFAKYWIHNGFVTINKEKMSKSLGNFFTLEDIYKKFQPRAVRYFLISQHYKTPLDFSDDKITQAESSLKGIDEAYQKLSEVAKGTEAKPDISSPFLADFRKALDDDFNTEKALSIIHDFKRKVMAEFSSSSKEKLAGELALFKLMLEDWLGIEPAKQDVPKEVLDIIEQRGTARKNKDWAKADELRIKAENMGYKIVDSAKGAIAVRK